MSSTPSPRLHLQPGPSGRKAGNSSPHPLVQQKYSMWDRQLEGKGWNMGPQGKKGRKGGTNGHPSQPNWYEQGILANLPIPQGQSFCGICLSSLLLAGIPTLCMSLCPWLQLTVRIEVINSFILIASITCGYSKHMLPRNFLVFHLRKNSFFSCVLSVQIQPY